MKSLKLPVVFLLAACIPLAAVGCTSGYDYANESSLKLSTGMTMTEVRAQLGDPDLIVRGDPGTETSWFYRYDGGASPAVYVLAFILVVLLVVVLVAAASGGGGGSWGGGGGGGGDGPPAQIKLTFDGDDHLIEISEPHPAPGR